MWYKYALDGSEDHLVNIEKLPHYRMPTSDEDGDFSLLTSDEDSDEDSNRDNDEDSDRDDNESSDCVNDEDSDHVKDEYRNGLSIGQLLSKGRGPFILP